tara:strand:+ start:17264 stop:18331 length:1068 start_codon:yes stop_codon:yes gene_type:complete
MSHLTTPEEAAAWRDELEAAGKKLVFTNGCFDLLHVGHVRYLREARELGDALIVALNGDASVRALKGEGRPINNAEDRAEILTALEFVDRVVVFDDPRVTGLIETIRPHIYTKGGDYTVESLNPEERGALERVDAEIAILSLVAGKSTSATLTKLQTGPAKLRIAVLGSGDGTNFEAIAEAVERGELDAEIRLVISDVEDAAILERAKKLGINALAIHPGDRRAKLSIAAQKEMIDRLKAENVDLIALAGFMRILEAPLLAEFEGRILNIHPSLLPAFPGRDACQQALAAGVPQSGCTIHIVDCGVDTGPILAQGPVAILPGDTPESLHERIQEVEHRLYPQVIGEFGEKLVNKS